MRRRGRSQLIVIFAVAAVSLVGAYLLFAGARSFGVWNTTNRGEFVDPPLTAERLALVDDHGQPFVTGGRWWVWIVAAEGCGARCEVALSATRQIQVLLHKDGDRVRSGLLFHGLFFQGPVTPPQGASSVRLFVRETGLLMDGAYIVDPLGNLVLWYSYGDVGKPLLDDLKRLLKVSQIG
jgi:cytochrome oxidase Cu insertion factor (SCO1/SenC/PrrC family)